MNKGMMRKMSVLLFGILCFVFALTQAVFAQENPVTSEILSAEDVKPLLIKLHKGVTLKQVIGIHQEGPKATIYYSLTDGKTVALKDKFIVRFNSGEWFDPKNFIVVTK